MDEVELVFRLVGLTVAAGLQPFLVLVVLAFGQHGGIIQLGPPYAAIGTTPFLLGTSALLFLQFHLRKSVAQQPIRSIRLPAVAVAGALGVLSTLPLSAQHDPAFPFAIGIVLAGMVYAIRAAIHRVAEAPERLHTFVPQIPHWVTSLLARFLGAVEVVAAALLTLCALSAPWLVPVVLIVGGMLAIAASVFVAFGVGAFIAESFPVLAQRLARFLPGGTHSGSARQQADWQNAEAAHPLVGEDDSASDWLSASGQTAVVGTSGSGWLDDQA